MRPGISAMPAHVAARKARQAELIARRDREQTKAKEMAAAEVPPTLASAPQPTGKPPQVQRHHKRGK
jgi:hypothetical protein